MFSRHEAQTAPRERAHSHEAPARHEQLSIPRETVEQSAPRTAVQNGPENDTPRFGETVFAGSTRWERGRGSGPNWGGVAAEVLGSFYQLPYRLLACTLIKGPGLVTGKVLGATTAALHRLSRTGLLGTIAATTIGIVAVPAALGVGIVGGAIYGLYTGIKGFCEDKGRAIISQATGGNLTYFWSASRAYRA